MHPAIAERIKRGNVLVWSSVHLFATTPVLWLYALILAGIIYGTHVIMLTIPTFYPIIIVLTFIATLCKIFIIAFIIHQIMNLPGGARPAYSMSIQACIARLWPLAAFAILESLLWGVCMLSGLCFYRAAYILIAIVWYTMTLPVIPLIIDNQQSLYELLQATMVIDAQMWLEALIGSLYSTLVPPLLYSSMNYSMLAQASPIATSIVYLLSAIIIVVEAIFKAVIYRAANRNRLEELSEFEVPYF